MPSIRWCCAGVSLIPVSSSEIPFQKGAYRSSPHLKSTCKGSALSMLWPPAPSGDVGCRLGAQVLDEAREGFRVGATLTEPDAECQRICVQPRVQQLRHLLQHCTATGYISPGSMKTKHNFVQLESPWLLTQLHSSHGRHFLAKNKIIKRKEY